MNIKKIFYDLCKEYKIIGANFVITDSKGILENYSYGYRDLEKHLLTDNKTIYRVASISKAIGAIGLLTLFEQGKIDLDEDISNYLGFLVRNPKFPNVVITVKMLMLHTSGILDGYGDSDNKKGYCGINGTNIKVSLKDLLTNSESTYYTPFTYSNNKPGTWWHYSNFGAGIIACIIENVSKEYYVDYMTEHLFKPLGLDASYRASLINNQENIATMYSKNTDKAINSDWKIYPKENFTISYYDKFPLGDNFRGVAGGLFIGAEDLIIIVQMLLNKGLYYNTRILKAETVEYMYQMQWAGSPVEFYLSKGLSLEVIDKLSLRGHTGGAYGLRSYMFFSLKYKLGACLIFNGFNVENEKEACEKIFAKTQDLFIGKYALKKESSIIVKQKEIHLEERKIVDKNLFKEGFIKAIAFCDMLDIYGKFNQEKNTVEMIFNEKKYIIDKTINYLDYLYIDFLQTLKMLEMNFQKKNDSYIIIN